MPSSRGEQWPRDGVPRNPARLAGLGRPLQGDRPARRRAPLRRARAGARHAARSRRRGRGATSTTRPSPTTGCASSSPAATPRSRRRAGRTDAARGVRPHHRGDCPRLPRADADGRAAHRPRQGAGSARPAFPTSSHRRRNCRIASTLSSASSTSSSTRATRRRPATPSLVPIFPARPSASAGSSSHSCPSPRRWGSSRSCSSTSRVALLGRPLRVTSFSSRPGPFALGPGADCRRLLARRGRSRLDWIRSVYNPGSYRSGACLCAERR